MRLYSANLSTSLRYFSYTWDIWLSMSLSSLKILKFEVIGKLFLVLGLVEFDYELEELRDLEESTLLLFLFRF